MEKIVVTLKQYTPLLHFQGEQEGACLRATEVKPALDRFIWRIVEEQGQSIPKEWKQKAENEGANGHIALRYSMRIQANGDTTIRQVNTATRNSNGELKPDRPTEIHPLYFGAMGEENFHKDTLESKISGIAYDSHTLTILCSVKGEVEIGGEKKTLTSLLEELLPVFFALHCFGTRSNKGFGSFYVEEEEIGPEVLASYLPETVPALYYVKYSSTKTIEHAGDVLDDVQTLSMLMKSGFNYTHGNTKDPRYYKGMIIQYFLGAGIHSDKAAIKSAVLPCPTEDRSVHMRFGFRPDHTPAGCKYVRGLLGTTQSHEYRIDRKNPNSFRSGVVTIEGTLKDSNGKSMIARYENPIHFKPHGKYLFLIPQEIPSVIPGAEFTFTNKNIPKYNTKLEIPNIWPTGTPYSLDDFLQYVQKKYTAEQKNSNSNLFKIKNMDSPGPATPIRETLKRVTKIERIDRKAVRTDA